MRATLAGTVVAPGISVTECGELDFPTDRDNFFHIVAVNFKVPELGGQINPCAEGGGGSADPVGYQITTLQSSCYRSLAYAMHDKSLCDRVVAVRTFTLDGSKDVVESEYDENPHTSTTRAAYERLRDDRAFLQRLQSVLMNPSGAISTGIRRCDEGCDKPPRPLT